MVRKIALNLANLIGQVNSSLQVKEKSVIREHALPCDVSVSIKNNFRLIQ